ncbi:MAG: hypothetical protein V4585_06080 [Bacteroidota bacterium]|jgi:hypothetical protein
MNEIIIEILGWIASILIVGAFALNSLNKIPSNSTAYQLANLIGGIFFVVNTIHHKAYPSAMVNVVWVFIAIFALLKKQKL